MWCGDQWIEEQTLNAYHTLSVAWPYLNKLCAPKALHPTPLVVLPPIPTTLLSFVTPATSTRATVPKSSMPSLHRPIPTMAPLLYPLPTNPPLKVLWSRLSSFMPQHVQRITRSYRVKLAQSMFPPCLSIIKEYHIHPMDLCVHQLYPHLQMLCAIRLTSGIGCLFTHANHLVYLSVYVQIKSQNFFIYLYMAITVKEKFLYFW